MAEPFESALGRDPDVLTTAELAAKLGLSTQTIRRMAGAGQIPALKTGKDYRFLWSAVLEVLRRPASPNGDSDEVEPITPRGAGFRARRRVRSAVDTLDER
jgi:excisionase family DNA binding protein